MKPRLKLVTVCGLQARAVIASAKLQVAVHNHLRAVGPR